jgi:hypothetical protein
MESSKEEGGVEQKAKTPRRMANNGSRDEIVI